MIRNVYENVPKDKKKYGAAFAEIHISKIYLGENIYFEIAIT